MPSKKHPQSKPYHNEGAIDFTIEEFSPEVIRENKPLIINKIKSERLIYTKLLDDILKNCKHTKEKLDIYYDNLQWYHSIVQTSVIIVSTGSTFIQSILNKEDYKDVLSTTTICVTTYSGLILSLAKFFKLDEKKENVHNLRERFAELHNRINYHIDLLKPWENDNFYDDLNSEKIERWKNIMIDIEKEYLTIIDVKKILFMEFEKLIDSIVQKKYTSKHTKSENKQKKKNQKIPENNPSKLNPIP
tara:strand:- start:1319 stop:2056 length:738 start_codon:yes stop_codon:yes gene_type:complete